MRKLRTQQPGAGAERKLPPAQKSDQLLEWVVTFFMAVLIVIIFIKIVFL